MAPIARSALRLILLVSVFSASLAVNVSSDPSSHQLASRDHNLPQHLDAMADGLQRRHHHAEISNRMEKKKRGLVVGLVQDLGDALGGGAKSSPSHAPTSTRASGSAPTSGGSSSGGSSNGGSNGKSGSSGNNGSHNDSNGNASGSSNQNDNNGGSGSASNGSGSNSAHANNINSGSPDTGSSGSASNVDHQGNASGNNDHSGGEEAGSAAASSGASAGDHQSDGASAASASGESFEASGASGSDDVEGSGFNRNLAAQKSPSTPSSGLDSADSASSSSTFSDASASVATNAVSSTPSTLANGSTSSGNTSGSKTGTDGSSSTGDGESSSESGKASKTSVAVPIVIVLVVLLVGGLIFWFVKKRNSNRTSRSNPADFQAVAPRNTPRPISQESFVAGRPQSSSSYLDRPMSEVGSIGVTSQGHSHGLDGFALVVPAAVASAGENPFADNIQNGRPISPETDNRTSHFWSSTGHSHEAYLTASDESGGLYYDGSSSQGYSNSAARGLDEAGSHSASGVQGAFSPYQDLQRGSSNRDSNGSGSLSSSSGHSGETQTYEPYSDGPYADDEESQQSHQNPFMSEGEYRQGLQASGYADYQGRNSSRWSG